jgi:hypothetical protein
MSRSTRTHGLELNYLVELIYYKTDEDKDMEQVAHYEYTEPEVLAITVNRRSKARFWNSLMDEFEEWPKDKKPIDLSFHDGTEAMHFPFVRYDHLSDYDKNDFDQMLESFMQTKDMSVYASCVEDYGTEPVH